jgi:hypothetical protein
MNRLEIGQELEFFKPAHVDGQTMEKGTRVRVGFVEDHGFEQEVMVVVLDKQPLQTVILPRHVLTLHCHLLSKHS